FKFDPEYWKLGIHRPSIKSKHLEGGFPDTVKWLNGSGLPMEDYFRFRGWRSIRRTIGYDWAQMNHYAVKSVDAYAVRKFRGNVNNKKDKYNADYWSLQDRNEVEDRAILRHAPDRARIMAELLTDPVLNRLHHAALDRVEARLAEYRQTEAYEQLRASLIEASKVPITDVEAKPPQARDPAKIAALMSAVEKKSSARPKEERRTETIPGWAVEDGDPYLPGPLDLAGDVPVDWVANHDIPLPADARIFRPEALSAIVAGRFERRHARNITAYLEGHERVLDIGVGIGFLPIRAIKMTEKLIILAHDHRADLIAQATEIARRAGAENSARLKWADGPLRLPGDAGTDAGGLAAYLHDFRPTALRISRAADVPAALLAAQNLKTLHRVLVPSASDEQAAELRAGYGPVLAKMGFAEVPDRAAAGSLQFDRSKT
ncbi:glycosyltransferase family 2 protein, partial [Roseicyclus sp.]|uniref:glycosyltransferase family 2 protein n=1 Tax=Roseicyclus sp. TaxID=1914329 RepID=UPI003F6D6E27